MLNPTARGDEALAAALSLREWCARAARDYDRAVNELEKAKAYFRGKPLAETLPFIDAIENDQTASLPAELQGYAATMRRLLDERRDAVQALGTGKLTTFYETYFPHIWKRGKDAETVFRGIFARRPIEGGKSFLKQRKFKSFSEGVQAGLEPVSENPVDLVVAKLKEMDRYLLAHRFLGEMRARKLAQFVPITKVRQAPQGWVEIPDPIGSVWGRPPFVTIPEARDKQFIEGLLDLARDLGINHRRVAKLRGAWGRSYSGGYRAKSEPSSPDPFMIARDGPHAARPHI